MNENNALNVKQIISLKWGEMFGEQIYEALQGSVVEVILKKSNLITEDNYYKNILNGHSFKVEASNLEKYFRIFEEVKQATQFDEDIDFYITGDSSINAYCIPSNRKDRAHILNINSGLLNIMTDDELRFVIGHEFGHLIDSSRRIKELINFVYPQGTSTPLALVNKIRIWQQLAEISADRCGFIACRDLNPCVSAFFKMSSGLDFDKMGLNFDSFIRDNTRRLQEFKDSKGLNIASHPNNLIRIEALRYFSEYGIFHSGDGLTSGELEDRMLPLLEMLTCLSDRDIDYLLARYSATMGLILGSRDGELAEKELNLILGSVAGTYIFPKDMLEELAAKSPEEIGALCAQSVEEILKTHPEMRMALLDYAISLVLADNVMNEQEVGFVFGLGMQNLGFTEQEVAQRFAAAIQASFSPSMMSIC